MGKEERFTQTFISKSLSTGNERDKWMKQRWNPGYIKTGSSRQAVGGMIEKSKETIKIIKL